MALTVETRRRIDEAIARWQTSIPAALSNQDLPGLTIGVTSADELLWSAGFGTRCHLGGVPMTPQTRFSVQSTSKLITATLVLIAVQEGRVGLDEPIVTYLPDFRVHSTFDEHPGRLITLRHLLSHTAGFTHEAPVGSNYDETSGNFDEHCRSIFDTWLRFPVGHHHGYSNLGIDLAGLILERAYDQPFAALAERNLFGPLGMDGSTFDPRRIIADPDRATGHWRPMTDAGRTPPVLVPMMPSGALYATVDDLLRYARLHLRTDESLLTSACRDELYRIPFAPDDQRLGYALGVYVTEIAGVRALGHPGDGYGFRSQLGWLPEQGVAIAVLTNSVDQELSSDIVGEFVRTVVPGAVDEEDAPGVVVDGAEDCVGEYFGRYDRVEVVANGGRHVVHEAAGKFKFEPGVAGSAGYLRSARDGEVRYRNDARLTPSSTLDPRHAGTYAGSNWGLLLDRYRIAQDGASPILEHCPAEGTARIFRLRPVEPGRYLSSTGELLDLTGDPARYANIPLVRIDGA